MPDVLPDLCFWRSGKEQQDGYDMKSVIWICFNGRSGDCQNLDSLDDQKLQASSGLLWMNDV